MRLVLCRGVWLLGCGPGPQSTAHPAPEGPLLTSPRPADKRKATHGASFCPYVTSQRLAHTRVHSSAAHHSRTPAAACVSPRR